MSNHLLSGTTMRNALFCAISLAGLSGCNAIMSSAGLGWPSDVYSVEIGGVYGHDLAEGVVLDDLSWASDSSVACFVETEAQNFSGSHVFFGLTQPADSYLTVAVTPDPGLDVNVYVMQMASDLFAVPPTLDGSPNSCNVGFDPVHDANPGESDFVEILGYNSDVNVLIGVAGPEGVTEAPFELELFAVMP